MGTQTVTSLDDISQKQKFITSLLNDIRSLEYMLNNDQFFALDNITNHVTIIGGGYISFEFAHIMAACGVHVTILSNEEMPLGAFDPDLVNNLIQATLAKGVDVTLG